MIEAPTVVVQGADDPYGTARQVDAIERGVKRAFTREVLPGCGHAPHRERTTATLSAAANLASAVFPKLFGQRGNETGRA